MEKKISEYINISYLITQLISRIIGRILDYEGACLQPVVEVFRFLFKVA